MKAIILGAGPSGLAIADELSKDSSVEVVVLERDDVLGGLARTIPWKNYGHHDLGPHKIFSLDKELVKRVEELLTPNDWITREKKSQIFMGGRYLPYPPSPFSLVNVYGPVKFAKMVRDYGLAQIFNLVWSGNPKTFKDDLEHRVGHGLYSGLFEPIAKKLWGDPADLDLKLSKGRIQTPSPIEVIARLLKIKKSSEFEALTFRYPKGGLHRLWNSISKKIKGPSKIMTGYEVVGIEHDDEYVTSIRIRNRATSKIEEIAVGKKDYLFSTIPLSYLPGLFNPQLTGNLKTTIEKYCQLNDLILVFFKIKEMNFIEDSWVFIPDPNIIFHRLSEQESFDPGMTPNGSIVCCEVMSHKDRPMASKSDEELKEECLAGIKAMKMGPMTVEDFKVIRLPKSYPVFRPGFVQNLQTVINYFDNFKNFRTVGRQGAFNYIGTMDAMDIGYGAAKWLLKQKGGSSVSWKEERTRTEHYPVLD